MAKHRQPRVFGNDCCHCHKRKSLPTKAGKGLCQACYYDKTIRAKYDGGRKEPTEADIDAMIAEQMRELPAWWQKSWEKMAQGDRAE